MFELKSENDEIFDMLKFTSVSSDISIFVSSGLLLEPISGSNIEDEEWSEGCPSALFGLEIEAIQNIRRVDEQYLPEF